MIKGWTRVRQHPRRRGHVPGRGAARLAGTAVPSGIDGNGPRLGRLVQNVLGNDDDDRPRPAGDARPPPPRTAPGMSSARSTTTCHLVTAANNATWSISVSAPVPRLARWMSEVSTSTGTPAALASPRLPIDIGCAAAAGHLDHAHPVADPGVRVRHRSGVPLVPGQDVAQPVLAGVQRVVEGDSGVAGHAEQGVNAGARSGPRPAGRLPAVRTAGGAGSVSGGGRVLVTRVLALVASRTPRPRRSRSRRRTGQAAADGDRRHCARSATAAPLPRRRRAPA